MNIRIATSPKLWFVPIPTNMKRRSVGQKYRQWKKDRTKKRYIMNGQMLIW